MMRCKQVLTFCIRNFSRRLSFGMRRRVACLLSTEASRGKKCSENSLLTASLVLFSINRWFQQWNDLHLQNNVLLKYLWCTVKLYCSESCRRRRLVVFVSAVFRSVTTRCETVLFGARWSQWLKRTVKFSDGNPTTSFSGYVVQWVFIAIKLL